MYKTDDLKLVFPSDTMGYFTVTDDGEILAGHANLMVRLKIDLFPDEFSHVVAPRAPGHYAFMGVGDIRPTNSPIIPMVFKSAAKAKDPASITEYVQHSTADIRNPSPHRVLIVGLPAERRCLLANEKHLEALHRLVSASEARVTKESGNYVLLNESQETEGIVPTEIDPRVTWLFRPLLELPKSSQEQ